MIGSFFKTAWRNFRKHKKLSAVNIIGLSIGIGFTILIFAYVWCQLLINKDLKNTDEQYIIQSNWKDPNIGVADRSVAQLPEALKDNYAHLVNNIYHCFIISTNATKDTKHFRENIQIGDSSLLFMYGLPMIQGNPNTALTQPYSLVVTKEAALKYFGTEYALGQTLTLENFGGEKHDFLITGILGEVPVNTVTNIFPNVNFFINTISSEYFNVNMSGWENIKTWDFVELRKGVQPEKVEIALKDILNRNAPDYIAKNLTPYLVPLREYNLEANGGLIRKMIYALSSVAIFILLMAIVNFINICIGRASARMKEMGIRKVLGGRRRHLIMQFLTESILYVLISTIVGLILFMLLKKYFSEILLGRIPDILALPVWFLPVLLAFGLFVGFLSGVYPAFVLSALKSTDSLKAKSGTVKQKGFFTRALVGFQFMVAAIVMIAAIIISQQVNLFFSSKLGYDKDYIIHAQLPRDWSPAGVARMEQFRSRLSLLPQVKNAAISFEIPDGINGGNYSVYRMGALQSSSVTVQGLIADFKFADTYSIPIEAGSFFSDRFNPADSDRIVINDATCKALGWKTAQEAVGNKIYIQNSDHIAYTISGVVANFHFGSMQDQIKPMAFSNIQSANYYRYCSIKLKPGNIHQNIEAIQKAWEVMLPGAPFEYGFMDDAIKHLYTTEIQLREASRVATAIAIIIVLLGVLGLISLSIQKRTKEIGIRKVLGASPAGIIMLFLKDFMNTALVAFLVASPITFLMMSKWLERYAYKIDLSIIPFVTAIIILTFMTILLITFQTLKTSLESPSKSIKSE